MSSTRHRSIVFGRRTELNRCRQCLIGRSFSDGSTLLYCCRRPKTSKFPSHTPRARAFILPLCKRALIIIRSRHEEYECGRRRSPIKLFQTRCGSSGRHHIPP
ncbi:unnamed protein product, partial [Ectocarpus fasciculatus]